MSKPFTVYLIHHSHTDIGYTDYQEKIEMHHVFYIREVVDILNAAHTTKPEWLGFKWNCESYWCVERFLAMADERYRADFIRYVKSGEIGLSGSYLNLTELVDAATLSETMAKSRREMERYGISMRSALTCDINGYSWGFADALYENGVTRLLSAIHTHHGYYPLGLRQTPFWWVSPKGNRILAWVGEHYHLGNELGIARQPAFEYNIKDGLDSSEPDPFRRAERRIKAYRDSLLSTGYSFDFAPVNISGMMTDNGFPNVTIEGFCREYNALHGDEITLRMATLDEFFDAVEASGVEIPSYSGDWTDWWADGIGSTPDVVQHAREAGRKLDALRALDPEGKDAGVRLMDEARYNLIFYTEHTWGFCSSVSQPWDPQVNGLDKRKALFACRANELASRALNNYTFAHGETAPSLLSDFYLTVVNPHARRVTDTAKFALEKLFGHHRFKVADAETGEEIPYQIGSYARGPMLVIQVTLDAGETRKYRLVEVPEGPVGSAERRATRGQEGITDLRFVFDDGLALRGYTVSPYRIETPYFRIRLDEKQGIASIYDKTKDAELVRSDAKYAPFTPIYEVTPAGHPERECEVRRAMGRNRKSPATKRFAGEVSGIRVTEQGPLSARVEIDYRLEGCEFCSLILTAYHLMPRLDADLRMHKKSVWDPENVYVALPFTAGEGEQFWIEKTGAVLRPRIDQLPGSCTDFYALQGGMAFCGTSGSVVIATPDAPLISMGPLEAHEIVLAGEAGADNIDEVYGWVMNNFWETNFKVSLGGFHQFRYSLVSTAEKEPADAVQTARETAGAFVSWCSFTADRED